MSNDTQNLYEELSKLRLQLAQEANLPAFTIFHNQSLMQMAEVRPNTKEALLEIHGIGPKKWEKYGSLFLEAIVRYCAENKIAHNPETAVDQEKTLRIRNSTAQFLIFTAQSSENSIEVRIADESVWLTQKLMGVLFEVSVKTINEHLINLFDQKEILREATIRNFRIVQKEGAREVSRNIEFYNLEAIIAVGFRVSSQRAIQFRQWAVSVLKDFAILGYVLDKERLKNGLLFNKI
ncbi:MAG TPA: RhuM family protein [Rhabdochlamydiaceae bacterium]|nr:RhuM family protein [Rhabdochlamydiaceae bacterium]